MTGGVDVLGAERGLAARERVEQRRPRGRAITRRQQRLAAQALELHAEAIERIARGQGLGEPLARDRARPARRRDRRARSSA